MSLREIRRIIWIATVAIVVGGCAQPEQDERVVTDDTLQPGDLVMVDVYVAGVPQLSRLDDDGRLYIAYAGSIPVTGKTDAEAAATATEELRRRKIDNQPVKLRRLQRANESTVVSGPIQRGDLLRIAIPDLLGVGHNSVFLRRVDRNGCAAVPFLGSVLVAGQNELDAEAEIVRLFRRTSCDNAFVWITRIESAAGGDLPDKPVRPMNAALREHLLAEVAETERVRQGARRP